MVAVYFSFGERAVLIEYSGEHISLVWMAQVALRRYCKIV